MAAAELAYATLPATDATRYPRPAAAPLARANTVEWIGLGAIAGAAVGIAWNLMDDGPRSGFGSFAQLRPLALAVLGGVVGFIAADLQESDGGT